MTYYWVSYIKWRCSTKSDTLIIEPGETVEMDEHPFKYIKAMNKFSNTETYVLTNWKEITKEEYDLFLSLNE